MSEHLVDESFHLAAMAMMREGTPLVRRERKPWQPREPIEILEFTEANDEAQPGSDSDCRDADVLAGGSPLAGGGE